jgi:flap endonuclease-1
MLKELELTQEQFVDLCILLGCDYTGTIPGIGYKRAYNFIKKYSTIENIIKGEKINPIDDFDYIGARNLFMNPDVGRSKYDAELKKLTSNDINKLREYLINVHGLELSRVNKSLLSLEKFYDIKRV